LNELKSKCAEFPSNVVEKVAKEWSKVGRIAGTWLVFENDKFKFSCENLYNQNTDVFFENHRIRRARDEKWWNDD